MIFRIVFRIIRGQLSAYKSKKCSNKLGETWRQQQEDYISQRTMVKIQKFRNVPTKISKTFVNENHYKKREILF